MPYLYSEYRPLRKNTNIKLRIQVIIASAQETKNLLAFFFLAYLALIRKYGQRIELIIACGPFFVFLSRRVFFSPQFNAQTQKCLS